MGRFLDSLNDATRYRIFRGVPVFEPHERDLGKLTITVTDADLPAIARKANEPAAADQADPITVGHRKYGTDPETGEEWSEVEQPPRCGFIWNFRVGKNNKGQPAVLADLAYDLDTIAAYGPDNYPYRSIDYRIKDQRIFGMAALIRKPELDLGVVHYRAALRPASAREPEVLCYACSCEGYMDDTKPADWTPEDEAGYADFMAYASQLGPKFAKYAAKYSASMGPANGAMPAADDPNKPGPDVAGYAARLAQLERAHAEVLKANREGKHRLELNKLRNAGLKFDENYELNKLAKLPDGEVIGYLANMATFYQNENGNLIATYSDPVTPRGESDPTRASDTVKRARQIALKNPGMSFDDAMEKAGSK